MSIINQILKAKIDYMTNVYDGHGKVSGSIFLTPEMHCNLMADMPKQYFREVLDEKAIMGIPYSVWNGSSFLEFRISDRNGQIPKIYPLTEEETS
jgi:hypothetical protein